MIFPTFFPDATRAVVRSCDSLDLLSSHVEGLIVNTYHLMTEPGTSVLEEAGGVKKFMNWPGFIISDSGGFQLLSMIYKNKSLGTISDNGVVFHQSSSGKKKKYEFTPEKSIQVQFAIGADIMICLDDCPSAKAKPDEVKLSVDRTLAWAKRCKDEFERQLELHHFTADKRPLLFGVVQGAHDKKERERCAKGLIEIGFDGYGFGGWPLDDTHGVNFDILQFTASLMPDDKPKYALGLGSPSDIARLVGFGYQIFDCVLPTRDARHERLYMFKENPEGRNLLENPDCTSYVQIGREEYFRDQRPISEFCDCVACKNYSKSYLQHLFRLEEFTSGRLATIHNLRTYTKLIETLRQVF